VAYRLESAGVLLASIVEAPNGDVRVLARKLRWIDGDAYLSRGELSLSIKSEGYVPALAEAEKMQAVALWVHTHPGAGASPRASAHDEKVDRQIADLFRLRSGHHFYGAAIFSQGQTDLTFTGYLTASDGNTIRLERLWLVGEGFHLARSADSGSPELSPIFDRNIRAFGHAIQETLHELNIGIVGCGGTGSAVAEQLVRLGVRHLMLIDPDVLSATNVTRVYGSTPDDVGKAKVTVLAAHLRRIAFGVDCEEVQSTITLEPSARRLMSCDVVFGCTDDNAGRLVLSRMPTYLLTPVIDCGVLLTSADDGTLTGIDGRITTLVPEQACLVCRDRIDLARAASELLTPEERIRRENEGYAPALGRTEPAVVAFTTMVGASAVGEFLERLVGYGPKPRPNEILLRLHEREISTNASAPRQRHYCHPHSGKIGLGATEPFLEQTWPS